MHSKKIKVTFGFKSRNTLSMSFKSFEISKLTGTKGNREMKYEEPSSMFSVDLDELEYVIIDK